MVRRLLTSTVSRRIINSIDCNLGSETTLWPRHLDGSYLSDYNCSSDDAVLFDAKCPSAGFLSLHHHLSSWWNFPDPHIIEYDVQDQQLRKVIYGISQINRPGDTWTYTTHAPTAVLLDSLRDEYLKAFGYLVAHKPYQPPWPKYLAWAHSKSFEVETSIPAVRTACMADYKVTISEDTLARPIPMQFPVTDKLGVIKKIHVRGSDTPPAYDSITIDASNALKQYLLKRSIIGYHNDSLTISPSLPPVLAMPMDLPPQNFTELGVILLRPSIDTNVWNASSCIVDARWSEGKSVVEFQGDNDMLLHEYHSDRVRNRVTSKFHVSLKDPREPVPNQAYPRIIHIDPSWYELLAPVLSDAAIYGQGIQSSGFNRSTLERLLESVLLWQRGQPLNSNLPLDFGHLSTIRNVEHIISTLFADGLSRSGSHFHVHANRLLGNGDWGALVSDESTARRYVHIGGPQEVFPKPSVLSGHESTRMEMTVTYTGYVMALQDGFDYFCVGLLLLHVAIALFYSVWVFCRKEIMEAWDTVPELVALAQNSPPPEEGVLNNTCAGIRTFRSMGRVAVVETQADGNEELSLRIHNASHPRDSLQIAKPEVEYGVIR